VPGASTSRRYEHTSTVLTSNKSFVEWSAVLGDDVMAAALIDRILNHCHVVNSHGNSCPCASTASGIAVDYICI
jgi:DNA replication protein DnaC